MRCPVITAMSALSLAVVGLSLRASAEGQAAALPVATSGIVGGAQPTPAAAPSVAAARPTSQAPTVTPSHRPRTVTVNGAPASTQYGPVQVQITLTDGRITAANAITYPRYDHREQQINDPAIPQLNQETLQAQSATIDTVSGATYTSAGYQQSLQSALDTAHAG